MCYGLARFGRQKAPVNRKYGHDPLGVMKCRIVIFTDQTTPLIFGVCRQLATVAVRE
jgi:hypothetical protein